MQERKLTKGWLKSYLDYIVKQESPEIFHLWVGISLISSVLRRNVYLDRGSYELYPNSYIVLVSDSGLSRKSGAIDIGMNLLEQVDDLYIIHGRATPEGLSDVMNRVTQTPDGKIIPDGSLYLHSDELSGIFGQAAYVQDLISFLLAVYSSRTKVDFVTRSKGIVSVRNPCLGIISATTPEQLAEIFTVSAMKSGVAGRFLFVWNAERTTRVPKPLLKTSMEADLIHDLKVMKDLYGVVSITPSAEAIFDSWYSNYSHPLDAELSPFAERIHDHVLKTATVLSIAESNDKLVKDNHMESAITAIQQIELLLPSVYATIGATMESKIGRLIIKILQRHYPDAVGHSFLLRRVYKHVQNAEMFRKIMQTLEESGKISCDVTPKGDWYKIKGFDLEDNLMKR